MAIGVVKSRIISFNKHPTLVRLTTYHSIRRCCVFLVLMIHRYKVCLYPERDSCMLLWQFWLDLKLCDPRPVHSFSLITYWTHVTPKLMTFALNTIWRIIDEWTKMFKLIFFFVYKIDQLKSISLMAFFIWIALTSISQPAI